MKYKRRNAIINRDEACIPPVSEKKSTINPVEVGRCDVVFAISRWKPRSMQ